MKRTMFGDPKPKGLEEMVEAIDEKGVDPAECYAELSYTDDPQEAEEFRGWSAEVRTNEDGDDVFTSLGYEDGEDLKRDLRAAGIRDIQSA